MLNLALIFSNTRSQVMAFVIVCLKLILAMQFKESV